MPTENRSSSTEVVAVPRVLIEKLEQFGEGSTLGRTVRKDFLEQLYTFLAQPAQHQGEPLPAFKNCIDARAYIANLFKQRLRRRDFDQYITERLAGDFAFALANWLVAEGQPAQQHQGDPIMLTAVATLVDDGDGGLASSWLLEGGTAELFAGMTLLVAENAPDLCSEDGSAQVYTQVDPAEVERLIAQCVEKDALIAEMDRIGSAEVERLREEIGGLTEALKLQAEALKSLIFMARKTGGTAGPDAALMKACEKAEYAISLGGVGRAYMSGADTALSASAEPSATLPPVEGDLLPSIGSKVLIHLAREDEWVEHTVAGYYAWENHGLDQNVHRVFVRVRDAEGYLNARMLNEIRPVPLERKP